VNHASVCTTLSSLRCEIEAERLTKPRCDRILAARGCFNLGRIDDHPASDIEPDHDRLQSRTQHTIHCFWVTPRIEVRRPGGPATLSQGTKHANMTANV
jgi:hypothetical protein